jgi:hypothetical protein
VLAARTAGLSPFGVEMRMATKQERPEPTITALLLRTLAPN